MWLVVGETVWWKQCVRSQDVVGGRKDRGLYGGGNVSGAVMWLYVGETEDSMVDAMYQEPGYGWRSERDRGLHAGGNV